MSSAAPHPELPMLELDGLVVRFGSFRALDGVSLSVRQGEILGFLGPNGAGKTTTMKILTGQLRPTRGSVRVLGQDLVHRFHRIKPLFGYVPDFDNHFEELTAVENLRFYARLYGCRRSRIKELLAEVGLENEGRIRVRHFSKGMKKKLTIARELLHAPRILFLDEPTANLDVHSAHKIRLLLLRLRDTGGTVFVSTHNMDEAEELCDRIALVDRGRIVEVSTPLQFKAAHAENLVDVHYNDGSADRRVTLRMADPEDRERLRSLIGTTESLAIHTKEFNFRQVFLKLTGRDFE